MVAVLCMNKTTPQFFEFLTLPPHPPGADGHHRGRGHVGRHCPYTNNIWCGSVQALLRYRSKTAKMQKFPIDSHSNKNFISPFSARQGPPTPKRREDTFGNRVRPHAKFGVNWPAGCREIFDKKRTKQKYLAFRSNERMAGNKLNYTSYFKNSEKFVLLIERLNAFTLLKSVDSGKLFQALIILHAKKRLLAERF